MTAALYASATPVERPCTVKIFTSIPGCAAPCNVTNSVPIKYTTISRIAVGAASKYQNNGKTQVSQLAIKMQNSRYGPTRSASLPKTGESTHITMLVKNIACGEELSGKCN